MCISLGATSICFVFNSVRTVTGPTTRTGMSAVNSPLASLLAVLFHGPAGDLPESVTSAPSTGDAPAASETMPRKCPCRSDATLVANPRAKGRL